MLLVDSGIVIAYLRTREARLQELLQTRQAAVTGVVRAEVMAGAKDPADDADTELALNALGQVDFPHALWDDVGRNRGKLFAAGLSIPFNDVVLATLAIHLDIDLWSRDRHFPMIQAVLPALKLFREPTP